MKKLFFMLVLIVGFTAAMHAQASFVEPQRAIELLTLDQIDLRKFTVRVDAPVTATSQQLEDKLLRKTKSKAIEVLIDLIPVYGNNTATIDRAFQDPYFSRPELSPAIVAEAKAHVTSVAKGSKGK